MATRTKPRFNDCLHSTRLAGRERTALAVFLAAYAIMYQGNVALAQSLDVYAVSEDTYVTNWGESQGQADSDRRLKGGHLIVSKSDEWPRRKITFMHFDLPTVSSRKRGAITAAYVKLKIQSSCAPHHIEGAADYGVHMVLESWAGADLDGSSIPRLSAPMSLQRPQESSVDEWVAWDITGAIRTTYDDVKENGLAITVNDEWTLHSTCFFHSSETGSGPELHIQYRTLIYLPYSATGRDQLGG